MLLASETAKERETKKMNEEIQDLLNAASTKEQMMSSKFKSQGGLYLHCRHLSAFDSSKLQLLRLWC